MRKEGDMTESDDEGTLVLRARLKRGNEPTPVAVRTNLALVRSVLQFAADIAHAPDASDAPRDPITVILRTPVRERDFVVDALLLGEDARAVARGLDSIGAALQGATVAVRRAGSDSGYEIRWPGADSTFLARARDLFAETAAAAERMPRGILDRLRTEGREHGAEINALLVAAAKGLTLSAQSWTRPRLFVQP
jgi:hypothetical protein